MINLQKIITIVMYKLRIAGKSNQDISDYLKQERIFMSKETVRQKLAKVDIKQCTGVGSRSCNNEALILKKCWDCAKEIMDK